MDLSKLYLANAFSLNMLELDKKDVVDIRIVKLKEDEVKYLLSRNEFESVIGHESTANIISEKLGIKVEASRKAIKLKEGDRVIVFQLLQRLPEGKVLSKEELEQVPCSWFLVRVLG